MLLTPRGVCSLCEDLTNPGADVDLAQWADGSPYYGIQYKNISYLPANAFTNIFKEGTLLVSKLYIAKSCHGNALHITVPLHWQSTGHQWFPHTKDQ